MELPRLCSSARSATPYPQPIAASRAPKTLPAGLPYPAISPAIPSRRVSVKARGSPRPDVNGGDRTNGTEPLGDNLALPNDTTLHEYLKGYADFCERWDDALLLRDAELEGLPTDQANQLIWQAIRRQAERDASSEPLLSSYLHASILSHPSFERSLAFVLSQRLSSAVLLASELFDLFHNVLSGKPRVVEAALADLRAVQDRDPACQSYAQALLHYKGYHAIQSQRIAHELWQRGSRVMASALQSRMSEVYAADIHPAARFGKGIMLDHGTGVVIGETVVVGDNVSILQNVTLGGTGKEEGDRHPKISDNVLIGACSSVLGNIQVGKGAQVAAGSLVLRPVPERTLVAGTPAVEIGIITGNAAKDMNQWSVSSIDLLQSNLDKDPFAVSSSSSGATGSSTDNSSKERSSSTSNIASRSAATSSNSASSSDALQGSTPPSLQSAASDTAAAPVPAHSEAQRGSELQRPRQPSPEVRAKAQKRSGSQAPKRAKRQQEGYLSSVDWETSDTAAQRKWPVRQSPPPEYFL